MTKDQAIKRAKEILASGDYKLVVAEALLDKLSKIRMDMAAVGANQEWASAVMGEIITLIAANEPTVREEILASLGGEAMRAAVDEMVLNMAEQRGAAH